MDVIEVKNLKKYFGKTKAVDDISFEVRQGEIFGFLGPNGAGKTTTIRCIMDFIRPTSGQIFISGHNTQKDSVYLKRKIGYLSGEVRLYEKWRGQEHIDFIEKIKGKSEIVDSLIKKLDFDPKIKTKHLSSGNKQKLGLILALMHQPEVLIMDEPTLGLDPLLQNTIYDILEKFKEKGSTIFMSSHILPEVERVCDRAGIIKEGKLVGIETIEELGEKRLRRIEVRFRDEYKKSDFDFDGVEKIEEIKGGLILTVRGDINPIVKKIADYNLHDLEISHATLEDVFLEFYEKQH